MTKTQTFSKSTLYGLVLAGGESSRMQMDKGEIIYHKKAQREHLADILSAYCEKVFISVKATEGLTSAYPFLKDNYLLASPLNALLTAFEVHPHVSWLVIACDMPLVTGQTIERLIAHQNTETMATAYKSPVDDLPEPLITIWHKGSYAALKAAYENHQKSPRRVLMQLSVTLVEPLQAAELWNANDPDDKARIMQVLKKRQGNEP